MTWLEIKGMGEGGAIGSAATIANAATDELGIRVMQTPITPNLILRLVASQVAVRA